MTTMGSSRDERRESKKIRRQEKKETTACTEEKEVKKLKENAQITIFVFYNKAVGVQSAFSFSKEFKHCNAITYNGEDFIFIEMDGRGFHPRIIKCQSVPMLVSIIKSLETVTAIITIFSYDRDRANIPWRGVMTRSCNEVCRHQSGANVGWTFNPAHLYRKLLNNKYPNYEILESWRKSHG